MHRYVNETTCSAAGATAAAGAVDAAGALAGR